MKKIIQWFNESIYIPPLSPACELCAEGSKLVLLVTGLCPARCFYCPLSFKKRGRDVIYADEWKLSNEDDIEKILLEAKYIRAEGVGITGGDPLMVWSRTKRYIELLKQHYGSSFHIHLYTSGLKNTEYIPDLITAGLDEIRFHPMPQHWRCMENTHIGKVIKSVLKLEVDTAIEIPVIPGFREETVSLIKWAEEEGVKWVNLNELEFSERNVKAFLEKGFENKNDISAAVKGSEELGLDIVRFVEEQQWDIGVHYCSASFKDGVQLRNRIKRRAENVAKPHEIITEDGTLLLGIIQPPRSISLERIKTILKREYDIEEELVYLNHEKHRVETNPYIVEEVAPRFTKENIKCYISEEYPTADRLEVERIPLP